ncbi:MAG: asparaginase [Xylophilus ampelinus]
MPPEPIASPTPPAAALPRVRLLATGGTIAGAAASAADTGRYRAAALGVEALLEAVPQLADIARVDGRQIAAIDSKDADPGFWQALGRAVQEALDDPDTDAVVVTHGTDTLEESAWYLQLVLHSPKPVVLTGAMRPATALSADGPLNLLQAVRTAACPGARGRGVLVVFNGRIHGADRLRKRHTSQVDAFASGEGGALGELQDAAVVWWGPPQARPASGFTAATPLAPVDILLAYPGVPGALLAGAMADAGARGIVCAGNGHGSLPAPLVEALAAVRRRGVAVARASRVADGPVMPGTGCDDAAHGFVAAGTLDPHKARIALMLLLGSGQAVDALPPRLDRAEAGAAAAHAAG